MASPLTDNARSRITIALADAVSGKEVADLVERIQESHFIAGAIVATSVSTTTDFKTLVVGDRVVVIPAVAGNASFMTVATAGTLPAAAVVGSLYVVLRARA